MVEAEFDEVQTPTPDGIEASQRHHQPQESGETARKSLLSRGKHSQERSASGDRLAGEDQVSDRTGRPACERDDEEPPPGAGDRGCGHVRVQAAVVV